MKSVLKVFADHANDSDQAWPHTDTIALESGLSAARVSPAINAAVKAGLLSKRRTQTGNRYRINMHLLGTVNVPPKRRHDPAFPEFEEDPPKQGADQPFSRNERSDQPHADQPFSRNEDPDISSRGSGDCVTRDRESRNETQNHQGIHREPSPTTRAADAADDGGGSATPETTEEHERARAILGQLRMPSGPSFNPGQEAVDAVTKQLVAGWSPTQIAEAIAGDVASYKTPAAGAMVNIRNLPARLGSRTAQSGSQRQGSAWPDWCGKCDKHDRTYENEQGRAAKCPTCHKHASKTPAPARTREGSDEALLGQLAAMNGGR